jgi:phage-related protein
MTAPVEHIAESQKLTADAVVPLWAIHLKMSPGTSIYIKDGPSTTWQKIFFESCAIQFSGDKRAADGQEAKPTLRVANPFGIFNPFLHDNLLDLATVIRYEVLGAHIDKDINIANRRMWRVGRVPEAIANQGVTLELRAMSEGVNFQLPVRTYTPDGGFPSVSL